MKHLAQISFALIITFAFACGGGKSDKTEETVKKDSSDATEKETPKTEETEKPEKLKEEAVGNQQVTIGTFVTIEGGDYYHFYFKPETGAEKDLFVLNGDETYQKIAANPEKYKGVKIKVTWERKKQNIPEAGGEMEIEEYIKSEILE
jgi:site-specific DNA-cytosine methylase